MCSQPALASASRASPTSSGRGAGPRRGPARTSVGGHCEDLAVDAGPWPRSPAVRLPRFGRACRLIPTAAPPRLHAEARCRWSARRRCRDALALRLDRPCGRPIELTRILGLSRLAAQVLVESPSTPALPTLSPACRAADERSAPPVRPRRRTRAPARQATGTGSAAARSAGSSTPGSRTCARRGRRPVVAHSGLHVIGVIGSASALVDVLPERERAGAQRRRAA